jgi:5-aminolevulinate synthase
MESLLGQSRAMCPFLKKTSPATLRSLSTATHHSPGGGTITNLQFIARRCPVMNKALAVQSARIRTATYTKAATGASTAKSLLEKKLHTSAEKKASVNTNNVFNNHEQGLYSRVLGHFDLFD